MQEAFRRAAEEAAKKAEETGEVTPGLQTAITVAESMSRSTDRELARIREANRISNLRSLIGDFEQIGRDWFISQVLPLEEQRLRWERKDINTIRERWGQSVTSASEILSTYDEGTRLLEYMAYNGMDLHETRMDDYYRLFMVKVLVEGEDTLIRGLKSFFVATPRFSPPAVIGLYALSDLMGNDDTQRKEFYDYMYERTGLRGRVDLPTTLASVSKYLWFNR